MYIFQKILFPFSFFISTFLCEAQDQEKIDSLLNALKTVKSDTSMVRLYLNIGDQYEYVQPDTALLFYQKALSLSEQIESKKFIAKSYCTIGNIYLNQDIYDIALDNYQKSLKINEELKDKNEMAACFGNIGLVYLFQTSYDKALLNIMNALKIFEEFGDKIKISKCYSLIGNIHMRQGNPDKSIDYYTKGLKLAEEKGDKRAMSNFYNDIGNVFSIKKSFDSSIECYIKSIRILEELGNKEGMAANFCNIGILYQNQDFNDKAMVYFLKALVIFEEFNDKSEISRVCNNLTDLNIKIRKYDNALKYAIKSRDLSKEIGALDLQQNAFGYLSTIYDSLGNYKKAYENHKLFKEIRDSIYNIESSRQVKQMEARYQNEKKQQQIILLNKDKELQKTEISKQKAVRNYLAGLVILILLIVVFVIRAYIQKQKNNKQLKILNTEITKQKDLIEIKNQNLSEANRIIEHKNKNITDSIRYAKRIQSAIFPPQELINRLIPDSFILYRPKSIVSGDFYWLDNKDQYVYAATVDCTGHGVPGAFMSIVGYNILNQALNEKHITKPAEILNFLSATVAKTLRQTDSDVTLRDGMDLVLCCIDRSSLILEFAGAHNSLYHVRNQELTEYKTDKFQIGQPFSEKFQGFNSKHIEIKQNDMIYLFSDGFIDQFNSTNNSKFTSKRFKELLTTISVNSLNEQHSILDKYFEEWKGNSEQTDDVTIFGMKF